MLEKYCLSKSENVYKNWMTNLVLEWQEVVERKEEYRYNLVNSNSSGT